MPRMSTVRKRRASNGVYLFAIAKKSDVRRTKTIIAADRAFT